MKKLFSSILILLTILSLTSCNNIPTTPKKKKIQTTKQFQFNNIKLNLSQLVKTDIVYHTQNELESILNKQFKSLLNKNNLLTTNKEMDELKITINYKRRFLGDETAITTDSLNYPNISYSINIHHSKGTTDTVEDNLTFKVNFVSDLKVFAGGFRDKKYELKFIDELANKILNHIN